MTAAQLPRRALIRALVRIAGVLVGVLFVALGAIFLFTHPDGRSGWWRDYVVPLSMVATGLVFVIYGVTGRDLRPWRSK